MNVKRPFRGLLHFGNSLMSKQTMRNGAKRLIRETMERKAAVVEQGATSIEARVWFNGKQCGHKQATL